MSEKTKQLRFGTLMLFLFSEGRERPPTLSQVKHGSGSKMLWELVDSPMLFIVILLPQSEDNKVTLNLHHSRETHNTIRNHNERLVSVVSQSSCHFCFFLNSEPK